MPVHNAEFSLKEEGSSLRRVKVGPFAGLLTVEQLPALLTTLDQEDSMDKANSLGPGLQG